MWAIFQKSLLVAWNSPRDFKKDLNFVQTVLCALFVPQTFPTPHFLHIAAICLLLHILKQLADFSNKCNNNQYTLKLLILLYMYITFEWILNNIIFKWFLFSDLLLLYNRNYNNYNKSRRKNVELFNNFLLKYLII